jgi:DUF1680 family protein
VDNGGRVSNLVLPLDGPLQVAPRPDLLGGVRVVTGQALSVTAEGKSTPRPFVAIPYFAWANRGKGEMAVWLRTR